MQGSFRLGIIGAGRIATEAHLPAALSIPGVKVTALVDAERQRCREVALQLGIKPKLAITVGEILGDVDGVVIATPNHTHCSLAVECLQSGVHTLIEKPMATCVDDCKTIIESGRARKAVVAVGYSTRFDEKNRLMGELIRTGFFGRIKRFAYAFGTAGGWAPVSGYNLDRHFVGGGVVAVSGSHFLDRMLRWFGYPDELDYADDSQGGPEANAVVRMRFGSGAAAIEGHARFSKTVSLMPGLVLDTEEGMVVLPEDFGADIRLRPHRNPSLNMAITPRTKGPKKIVYRNQLENFIAACKAGSQPEVTGQQGLESVRLIQEMYSKKRPLVCDSLESLWEEIKK